MAANKPCAEGETESFQVEYRLQHKDGSWRWILGWPLDITDRKKAEREIKEKYDEPARFRQLAVGREKKMIELKKDINERLKENGFPEKYKIH